MKSSTTSSQELKIRKAIVSDAGAICEIYNQGIAEGMATFETERRTESERRKWIGEHDDRHPILVAVRLRDVHGKTSKKMKEAILGWGSISVYNPRPCYSGIGEVSTYVKKGFRGRKLGKVLLMALIEEAKRCGYWKILGRIFTSNVASRNLCKSCGFREVGIHEKHGKRKGKWVDIVIVEKLIHENLT